jgi:hypothetical protein
MTLRLPNFARRTAMSAGAAQRRVGPDLAMEVRCDGFPDISSIFIPFPMVLCGAHREASMKVERQAPRDAVGELLGGLRTSQEEVAALQALEQSGNKAEFTRALIDFEKRETLRSLESLQGFDREKFNPRAYRLAATAEQMPVKQMRAAVASAGPSILAGLVAENAAECDCIVPFKFSGLRTYGAMTGPDLDDVRNGMLGATCSAPGEYTVSNPGNTTGTTRTPMNGQMWLSFTAQLPKKGSHYLLMVAGDLWVQGHTRVVGHGNSSTCYDAKVWVKYFMVLVAGPRLIEIAEPHEVLQPRPVPRPALSLLLRLRRRGG